jgi:[CysO sulfur-carrier protein]-S-L-cysteine hydrolase
MRKNDPDKVCLPDQVNRQILAHALSTPAVEVCGLLGGYENRAVSVYPVKNIARDQSRRFLMDPEQQINAMRMMHERGELFWGIYHSHPKTDAQPSATDLEMAAYPDVYYFVVSLLGPAPDIQGYCFDGTGFQKITATST